jgi:excisionase family DNA binding protein
VITVSDVLEVRPGTVRPEDLAALELALEGVERRVGETPRLVGPDDVEIELPEGIHALLVSIVENLKAGNGVSVIPMHAELTTVEAAQLLNVSRPFLIKKLEADELPHHMVGTHRRLKLADVLAYRDRLDIAANEALDAMTAEAEELGPCDE